MAKIRIGIFGYGNLGRACERAVENSPDMKLVAVFTKRDPRSVTTVNPKTKVVSSYDVMNYRDRIDIMINCGGSATDLPKTTAMLARYFNVIDSFDHHEKINDHFLKVHASAKENGTFAIISCGWEPGFFSVIRTYFSSFLPGGSISTFWGEGISQGHSEAIRHIHGVTDARQYTVPDEEAIEKARSGKGNELDKKQMHRRVCYVSAMPDAYENEIEEEIKNIPDYFAGYDTEVNFVSREELNKEHSRLYHGGYVISTGTTGDENASALMELRLKLDSNPDFTAGILTAYARAAYRAVCRNETGCKTALNITAADISPLGEGELRKTII